MAEVVYWLGEAAETSASVCVRVDTAGSYTVRCNGVETAAQSLNPATNFGIARFNVSGLNANQSYDFGVYLAGALEVSGTLRTMPTAQDSFHIAWVSCISLDSDPIGLLNAVRNYDIRALFGLGDLPYCDGAIGTGGNSRFGTTNFPGSYTAPTDINTWHNQYLYLTRDVPSWAATVQQVPFYRMWDDHEALCNDYDHKLANVNTEFTGKGGSTFANQAAVDAAFALSSAAFDLWAIGNPANTSPLMAPWKPANAAALNATAHRARNFSATIGPAKFHVIDPISCRSGTDDTDGGDLIENVTTAKTLLGRPQLKWLKSQLLTSDRALNPIMSGKCTYKGAATSDNHGYNDCVTERDHLVRWIAANARGVAWATGDVHAPFVISQESHAMINSAPLSQADQDGTSAVNLGTTYTEGVAWKAVGPAATNARGTPRCIGMAHVTPTHIDWFLVSDLGVELCRWRQFAGANRFERVA